LPAKPYSTMPPRRTLSAEDRGRALGMLQRNTSMREVARQLGVSHSVISRLWHRHLATGRLQDRPRSGRPKKTTNREDRYITRQAIQNRWAPSSFIRQQLRAYSNVNVSLQTIRNRLHAANIRSYRPAVRRRLTPDHRRQRRAFCRRHGRWNRRQWAQVLFSDESRFCLFSNDGRRNVWRRRGERYLDCTVRETVSFGGGSVMVWGAFSLHHRSPLYHVQGNLTGVRYRDEILARLVVPTLQLIGPGAILQDDNARPHRAGVANNFVQAAQINRMDWPSNSPDLNPIEHVWDELDRRVRRNHPAPANANQLLQMLQAEWQGLPQAFFTKLINSMRTRCADCLNNNGGYTRY